MKKHRRLDVNGRESALFFGAVSAVTQYRIQPESNARTPCQNICHVTCLQDEETFMCSQATALSMLAGNDDPVIYLIDTATEDDGATSDVSE